MDNLSNSFELETLEEILEEEFNPEIFYTALSNALDQLQQQSAAEAA